MPPLCPYYGLFVSVWPVLVLISSPRSWKMVLLSTDFEIEIPPQACLIRNNTRIFWDCSVFGCPNKFESTTLQAVAFLQSTYRFVVVDYSYYMMLAYKTLGDATTEMSVAVSSCYCTVSRWHEIPDNTRSCLYAGFPCVQSRVDCLPLLP